MSELGEPLTTNGSPEGGPAPQPGPPGPEFTVLGVRAEPNTAAPTLVFSMGVSEPNGREVYAVSLRTQIHLDPARRAYEPETRELLVELFGDPKRWGATTHSFRWATVDVLVPRFTGTGTFELSLACTYDLELAAAKYLYSLPDGEAPLSMHFSGMMFYPAADGRLQIVHVPWSTSTRFGLPVSEWKAMIQSHYPDRGWVALHADTLERLYRRKAQLGATTFDACVRELLDRSAAVEEG